MRTLAIALVFAGTTLLLGNAPSATCSGCIPTPCGVDANCDPIAGCHCFVPVGSGMGHCG